MQSKMSPICSTEYFLLHFKHFRAILKLIICKDSNCLLKYVSLRPYMKAHFTKQEPQALEVFELACYSSELFI